jgi:hypothetical protein
MLSKAQTTYAELTDLCSLDEFDAAFSASRNFVPATIKGRRYWYYQSVPQMQLAANLANM